MKRKLRQLNKYCLILPVAILGWNYAQNLYYLIFGDFNYDGFRFDVYTIMADVVYLSFSFIYLYINNLKHSTYVLLIFGLMNFPLLFGVSYISVVGLITSIISLVLFFVYMR